MFTKRHFPVKMPIPKNTQFLVGVGYTDVLETTMLKFDMYFQNQSVISMLLEKETVGLFDFSPEQATSFVIIDGAKFFEALNKTNVYRGFELEVEKNKVKILYDSKCIELKPVEDSIPKKNYSKIILPDHILEYPDSLTELSRIAQVHKTAKDVRLNSLLSNSHIAVYNDSICFWSTYGGIWHTIPCHFKQSENIIEKIEGSWNIDPVWFKWLPFISEDFQHVSIRNDSGNKTYLCLDDEKSLNQVLIRIYKDECIIHFPEIPEHVQDKLRACNSLKLSERDRKVIRKNGDTKFYRVCPEVWV